MSTRPLVLPLVLGSLGMAVGCAHAPMPSSPAVAAEAYAALAATDYYAKVPAHGAGRELLASLHGVVAKHKDLGYDKARNLMFSTVDEVTSTHEIVDIYSGRSFRGVTDSKTAFERGLNTEHTWCQSNGAKGTAKDDLHAIFPVDGEANSARNNHPYGEVSSVTQELPDFSGDGFHSDLGKGTGPTQDTTVFEPRQPTRGKVPRAVLYFYTVYARFDGKVDPLDVSNFKLEEPVVIKWSAENPPSAAEKARNEEIFKLQGNRNPYVDHPEWVAAIGKFLP